MGKRWWRSCLGVAGGSMAGVSAWAGDAPVESTPYVESRYRYGNLHADDMPRRGHANTLRLQVGYHWVIGDGWSAYGEGIRTWALFGQQYDDGSGRRTPYPAEGDPASTAVSNAWLEYRNQGVAFRAGRQYVVLDTGRFISNNPWRQNLQSFDGLQVAWKAWEGVDLRYYWLGRVNRSTGADFPDRDQRRWKLDAHLLHLEQALPLGQLVAYGYFIRNDTTAANSVKTMGVRWTGSEAIGPERATLAWTTDVARQRAHANNRGGSAWGTTCSR
ncbi:MAG: alginate export family protein [Luteibacter sp.]